MIKWFLIYALVAALIVCPWFTVACYEKSKEDISRITKEIGATNTQVVIVLYMLLILLGWMWLPYKVVATVIKKIKGD